MEIIKPKYTESIVNMIASIYSYYGGTPDYGTITELDKRLQEKASHVLLLVFDGMGYSALESHLSKDDFLRIHMTKAIQSVFPPTTTAAMTSYYTGLSPLEHGWLGWSLYFKEYASAIDVFTNRNSYTGELIPSGKVAYELLAFTSIYKRIKEVNETVQIHTIKPSQIYFPSGPNQHHGVDSLEEMRQQIKEIHDLEDITFTAAYWPDPDLTMHNYGPNHELVCDKINEINTWVEALSNTLDDTLIIVSADHGLTEIKEEINLCAFEDLMDCLIMPPSIEARAMSFWIKSHKKKTFEGLFNMHFAEDFILYSKEEVMKNHLFGMYTAHKKVDDFVGDFLAVATGSKLFYYKTKNGIEPHHFKGHHAGLTHEEMFIPLIIKTCKKIDS